MAWVQVGPHKINTALICYIDQEGEETVRIYFHGEWEGNPLDLHFDEAKALWKYLKAEDLMMVKDKGSAAVMPKLRSASYDVHSASGGVAPTSVDKAKPIVPPSSGSSASSSSHSHSHSHKHGEKHSHSDRHAEHKKH
ncbi:MAG TPA: hypothetical protein VH518_07020 [Tepidisphaeraceae bacterium]|jgi:hypothetical protein